jgi:hypothetical protein
LRAKTVIAARFVEKCGRSTTRSRAIVPVRNRVNDD